MWHDSVMGIWKYWPWCWSRAFPVLLSLFSFLFFFCFFLGPLFFFSSNFALPDAVYTALGVGVDSVEHVILRFGGRRSVAAHVLVLDIDALVKGWPF